MRAVADAVKGLGLDADVYLIGGAAEGRLTILSDIDVLASLNRPGEDPWRLRRQILARAMDEHGLPWDYPIELHIHSREECEELLKGKKALKL